MNCGPCSSRFCLCMSILIALVVDSLRVPDRLCADAIFYILRTGCQWQALDQTELCAHSTAHDRFQEWVQAGVFLKLWQAGVERFEELCGIDWEWLSMDGAMRHPLP
jgi:putative transposase